jgi:Serine/threonine protein kinase
MVDLSGSSSLLKLVDMGDAVSVTRNLEVLPPPNLEFAAPEMVLGQPVGCKTDMWSVGVFLYSFLRWDHILCSFMCHLLFILFVY